MKILKILLPILIPIILVSLCFIPCESETQNQLLNVVAAIGTFGALLFLILDKKEKEKEEQQKFWHDHLPYLTIGSPCDPTQNRCAIDLLTNLEEFSDRGCKLFSIPNFSSANAYNITLEISTSEDFAKTEMRSHFIDCIPVTHFNTEYDNNLSNFHFIYSKYHINPETKQVKLDEFDLCKFTSNCDTKRGLKTIFIRLQYFSAPLTQISKKIVSVFKADLECNTETRERFIPPEIRPANAPPETNSSYEVRTILINNILRISYNAEL